MFILAIEMQVNGSTEERSWYTGYNYFISFSYAILLLVYIIVFKMLTLRLHKSYPKFYSMKKVSIFIINGLIIASMISRMVLAVVLTRPSVIKELDSSFWNNTWLNPLVNIFITIVNFWMPIASIIYSLIHSFNNKKLIMQIDLDKYSAVSTHEISSDTIISLLEYHENNYMPNVTAKLRMNHNMHIANASGSLASSLQSDVTGENRARYSENDNFGIHSSYRE